jgi:[ribosomal protein S5]-alanine N-acetyltransferase
MPDRTVPPLVSSSCLLRRFSRGDVGRIFELSQESGLQRWIPDQVYADEAEAREVLGALIASYDVPGTPERGPFVLGVCLPGNGELVGHVGLSPLGVDVEVGYAIGERWQGQGLATEAVRTMARWGLQHFGLSEVLAVVAVDNLASRRVLEKAGFQFRSEAEGSLHGRRMLVRTYELGR